MNGVGKDGWDPTPAQCGSVGLLLFYNQYTGYFLFESKRQGVCDSESPPLSLTTEGGGGQYEPSISFPCSCYCCMAELLGFGKEERAEGSQDGWSGPMPEVWLLYGLRVAR